MACTTSSAVNVNNSTYISSSPINNLSNNSSFNSLITDELLQSSAIGYHTPEDASDILERDKHLKDISIFHINIRSLNANYLKLLDLLSTFENQFDIIVLSEIWCTNISYFDNIFKNYHFVYSTPVTQKSGGIGILVHSSLSFNVIDSSNDTDYFSNLENISPLIL